MKSLLNRLWSTLVEEIFTNWRLALLGLTGLALSVASGWTTWDGMNNFTGNPVLSLLITFGIQGVMLIAAWLIGETFALGLRGSGEGHAGGIFWGIFLALSVIVIAIFMAFMSGSDPGPLSNELFDFGQRWSSSAVLVIVSLAVIGAIVYAVTQREIIGPYLRGGKIIIQNLPIWLMFLSCMGTSVFFSFDSLFATIFPENERKRAGDIRAQNRVSGILADVEARLKQRQIEARKVLFKSAAWTKYDATMDLVQSEARRAPDLVTAERKRRLAAQQLETQRFREQQSTAEGRFRNLKAEKARRLEVIDRIERLRPPLVAEIDKLEIELQAKRKVLLSAKADAMAEARGVGNTQRAGRGPKYRELQKVVTKLSIEEGLIVEQLKGAQANLGKLDDQIGTARREVEAFETKIATYGSQAEAARKMLETGAGTTEETNTEAASFSADGFERARSAFRQAPTQAGFVKLQRQCGSILSALITVPSLKESVQGVDCEPKDANALASQVFAYNNALTNYAGQCGKSAAAKFGDVDALIKHGQQCVLLSGLSGKDSADFRASFNRIELNRDDKAHRFVVTWNAFLDGNRLAYLALAIAIAIDGLVFMSGMFGANALRTPLAEGSGAEGRTAQQLDDLLESALLPNKLFSADVLLGVLRPSAREGFSQKIIMAELDNEQAQIVRNVLNAGSVIGLVTEDENDHDIYYIRRQLFEKVSHIRQREIRLTKSEAVDQGLRRALESALLPEQETLANISHVMKFMHPSDRREGFGLEVDLTDARGEVLERVKRVLTAGASFGVVKPHPEIPKLGFLIKSDFNNQLIAIREDKLKAGAGVAASARVDFDRHIRIGKIEIDEQRVSRQLDARKQTLLEGPRKSSVPSVGSGYEIDHVGGITVDHVENELEGYGGSSEYESFEQLFAKRLNCDASEIEITNPEALREAARDLETILTLIGRSYPIVSESVESAKGELRKMIEDCRRVLLARYSSDESARSEIVELSKLLNDVRPLFVLRNDGAYERAVNFFITHLRDAKNTGQVTSDAVLGTFERHASELNQIDRKFLASTDWEHLEGTLNEFYRELNLTDDVSGHPGTDYPLN